MSIHIGKLIKQRLEEIGINKSELARRINTTPQNIYGIFKRTSIDTDLLRQISHVLEFDFFQYFEQEYLVVQEARPHYKTKSPKNRAKSVAELKIELDKCLKELELLKKENTYLKEINNLLKEKIK